MSPEKAMDPNLTVHYHRKFDSVDPRWAQAQKSRFLFPAAILGISAGSTHPLTEAKLDCALAAILEKTNNLYISNTYTPYQHVFMAEGLDAEQAFLKAKKYGNLWLEQSVQLLEKYKLKAAHDGKTLTVIDWALTVRNHPEFASIFAAAKALYHKEMRFRSAVRKDALAYLRRRISRNEPLKPASLTDRNSNSANPFSHSWLPHIINSALEKISGYTVMTRQIQARHGGDRIAYFHNGPVAPQIEFFRNADFSQIPLVLRTLPQLVYVNITFNRKHDVAEQIPEENSRC